MNRTLHFAGLVLASLTISTVAMAQQGDGGGGGGGNGGGSGNSGDTSVLEVLRADANKARLTRAVQPRRGNGDCQTAVCEQQGTQRPPRGEMVQFDASCSGGEVLLLRGPSGRTVRYLCRNI